MSKSIQSVCIVMLVSATVASVFAWIVDRPGIASWCLRIGVPILDLIAIVLLRKARPSVSAFWESRSDVPMHEYVPSPSAARNEDEGDCIIQATKSDNDEIMRARGRQTRKALWTVGVIWAALSVLALGFVYEGIHQIVTQIGVTRSKSNPTPITISGRMAVLNGLAYVAIGLVVLSPWWLAVQRFWKQRSSQKRCPNQTRKS